MSSLYLTGLDVLDDIETIKLCKRYKRGDEVVEGIMPNIINEYEELEPIYSEIEGWK